jgi:hypothetical protein
MKFVELKTDGKPIWVNPANVVFIEASGQGSEIFFAAIAGADAVLSRRVTLSPSQVVEQLHAGLRG